MSSIDANDALPTWRAVAGRATTLRTIGIVAGGWSLVCLTFAAHQMATGSEAGPKLSAALSSILLFNMAWMALTPPLLAIVWVRPPGALGVFGFGLVHVGLCAVATGIHLSVFWMACAAFGVPVEPSFAALLTKAAPTDLIIYWALVGIALGVEQRRRIQERTAAADSLEANLSDARAAMLRAQLRPHFLFNTLNAISALIREQPDVAERMVARLGDLLRLSLDDTRGAIVPLAVDLATVDAYLAIETLRLGDRLRVMRNIAPETLAAMVPDLLLQPLVENAVVHGIAASTGGGTLSITAAREGPSLIITVADDGVGVEIGDIEQGVGLRSVRERVIARSTATTLAAMDVQSGPGAGFRVTIALPWQGS